MKYIKILKILIKCQTLSFIVQGLEQDLEQNLLINKTFLENKQSILENLPIIRQFLDKL